VELAAAPDTAQPGGLIMAAISAVFTISYVADLLGEDEDWLFELSIGMEPEDGSLWVYAGLHPRRYRLSTRDHRRGESRRTRATDQAAEIAHPAVLTACLRSKSYVQKLVTA
jgi:hypothetical protein